MSNKKGFIFIETIITIVVLAAALLYIYSNFNDILIKEKTRIYYDDISYIYRTYHVKEFFLGNELTNVLNILTEENPMVIIGCDYEGLLDSEKKETCYNLYPSLYITNIVVSLNDLSYVRTCDDDSTKCSYLNNFSKTELDYFKTLGNVDADGKYIMIIEYTQELNASKIIHNYAWVRI